MICKEDLVSWFKNLESYRRIDLMCTLLNMCLPFELRFLGTCLEELGRRDAQDLRGVELRVNNPQEFAVDVSSFQSGEPTDLKIRRKMALYLALMRACDRTCVNELFKTLDSWGDRDFTKFGDGDPLQELLLVYTMATNHPVFSFEQRMKCGEVFSKLLACKAILTGSCSSTSSMASPTASPLTSANQHQAQHPIPMPSQLHQSTSSISLSNATSPPPAIAQHLLQPASLTLHQPLQNPIMLPQIPLGFGQVSLFIQFFLFKSLWKGLALCN